MKNASTNTKKLILGLLTPVITAAAGWLTASVAKYGVHLDAGGVNAAMLSGAAAGISVMLKVIHDLETGAQTEISHELPKPDAQLVDSVVAATVAQVREPVLEALQTELDKLAQTIEQAKPLAVAAVHGTAEDDDGAEQAGPAPGEAEPAAEQPAPEQPAPEQPAPAVPGVEMPAPDVVQMTVPVHINGGSLADTARPSAQRGGRPFRPPRQG